VDKGKVRFIQINHGVTPDQSANVGTLVIKNIKSMQIIEKKFKINIG
jgi:hypothetical protein